MIILSALFAFIAFAAGYAEYLLGWEVRSDFEFGCALTIVVSAILVLVFLCCGVARHTKKKSQAKRPIGAPNMPVYEEGPQMTTPNTHEMLLQQSQTSLEALTEQQMRDNMVQNMEHSMEMAQRAARDAERAAFAAESQTMFQP